MEIKCRDVESACIFEVTGDVDAYNAHEIKDSVSAAVDRGMTAHVINMKKTTRLDSSGIGTLISLSAALARKGLAFFIVNVPAHIMQVLELTRTRGIIPTTSTVLAAFHAIGMIPGAAPAQTRQDTKDGARDLSLAS